MTLVGVPSSNTGKVEFFGVTGFFPAILCVMTYMPRVVAYPSNPAPEKQVSGMGDGLHTDGISLAIGCLPLAIGVSP